MAELRELTSCSTKQSEIEFLAQVRELAGENTYLANLFDDRLLNWVEGQIQADKHTDVMASWGLTQKQLAEHKQAAQKERSAAEREVSKLEGQLQQSERQIKNLAGQLTVSEALKDQQVKKLEADLQNRERDIRLAFSRMVRLDRQLSKAQVEVRSLRCDVDRLKIQLYDLMDEKRIREETDASEREWREIKDRTAGMSVADLETRVDQIAELAGLDEDEVVIET